MLTDGLLEPCPNPWCDGSKPMLVTSRRSTHTNVFCDNCDIGPAKTFDTPAEAISAWSTGAGQIIKRERVVGVVEAHEAIVEQGGLRAILVMDGSTAVETFSNGYEQPTEATWVEARAFVKGWNAALTAIKGGDDAD